MNVIDIAGPILKNTFYQLFFTIGPIAVVGLLVGLLNIAFIKLVGNNAGRTVSLATGFIGVPVHEIGHALFCVIFGHRIIEINLYQPDSADGTLGYVNHAYNKKSVYQQIGNFFIGFGPILFGCVVLLFLMFWLVPNLFTAFITSADFSKSLNLDIFSLSALENVYKIIREASVTLYSSSELNDWRWWAFIIPACSIALHMSLSLPDIISSFAGFCFVVITLLAINAALYFVNIEAMLALTNYSLIAGALILNFLIISILFSIILVLMGLIFRVLKK